MYSLTSGNEVEQVGICYPDEKKLYGCSPDGLIGDVGLVEIKCPTAAVHVSYLLDGGLPADYFQQVMGQLLITGREWCDFFSFYPGLPHMLVRVGIESSLKTAFTRELEAFVKSLETVVTKLKEI
jgi:hypothetical protein